MALGGVVPRHRARLRGERLLGPHLPHLPRRPVDRRRALWRGSPPGGVAPPCRAAARLRGASRGGSPASRAVHLLLSHDRSLPAAARRTAGRAPDPALVLPAPSGDVGQSAWRVLS